MGDAVIVATARTAIGTAFKGSLIDVDAYQLATRTVGEAVARSGLDPALIEDMSVTVGWNATVEAGVSRP